MASTAHKNQEDKKEYFDPPEILDKKITQLADFIRNSKHFIAFTGAGISTACGIPDFRSGANTVLPTGPGAWEKKALNINPKPKLAVQMAKAKPSITHMSLLTLHHKGFLKYLISQNTDGLHLRSGFPGQYLAQLHGNRNLQTCKKCKRRYLRDFRTREAQKVHDHQTSRKCENCGSKLYDSIINFGENLPQQQLEYSFNHAQSADLCLAMGSSLTVTPAADIPKTVGKKQKLVIVNLQKTPLDGYAKLKINALCDDVMKKLMQKLELPIQKYVLERYIQFKLKKDDIIQFRGIDSTGIPYSFLKGLELLKSAQKNKQVSKSIQKKDTKTKPNVEPYVYNIQKNKQGVKIPLQFNLKFYGHYNQPDLKIKINPNDIDKELILKLSYDPYQAKWLGAFPQGKKEEFGNLD